MTDSSTPDAGETLDLPPLKSFSNLRFYTFDSDEDVDRLLNRYFLTQFGNDIPARRILELLVLPKYRPHAPCVTVVAEEHYFDRDHFDAYNRVYSGSYLPTPKTTVRLHFFSREIAPSDLINAEGLSDHYLGYTVVRPTEAFRVGRTVVSPPASDIEDHVLGQYRFEVNLSGSRLEVRGVPFMEQDTQVAACATACLWMVSEALAGRFGTRRHSTTEITEFATRFRLDLGAALPSPGLSPPQLMEALRGLGFQASLYFPGSPLEAKQLLYWYVESEIPVMALLSLPNEIDGHVVAVIGHGYSTEPLEHPGRSQDLNIDWVPYFIVHDDQGGPYLRMRLLDDVTYLGQAPLVVISRNVDVLKDDAGAADPYTWPHTLFLANIHSFVVPMPQAFSVDAGRAEERARVLLAAANSLLGVPSLDDIVLRTYLIPSNEFKRRLDPLTDPHSFTGMLPELVTYYRSKPLPRFVWVVELSKRAWIANPLGERLIQGEIILDPYSSPHGLDFVFVHVPGFLAELVTTIDSSAGFAAPSTPDSAEHDDDDGLRAIRAIERAFKLPADAPYTQLTRMQWID